MSAFLIVSHFIAYCSNTVFQKTNITSLEESTQALANFASGLTLPGTLWCGYGNSSDNVESLGYFKEADQCCRAHDACTDYIDAGEVKHGLRNFGFFSWSHCSCDKELRACLRRNNDYASTLIGFIFFDFLGPKCFKKEYPVAECKKIQRTNYSMKKTENERCVRYEVNPNEPRKYQWFDNPLFW